MKLRNWLILGLALLLVVPSILGLPGNSQAQQNGSSVARGPGMQGSGSGYYGNNDSSSAESYRPMGPGYRYSGPANQDYRNNGSRTWRRGNQGDWCPWNGGYARGYRNGRGHCW